MKTKVYRRLFIGLTLALGTSPTLAAGYNSGNGMTGSQSTKKDTSQVYQLNSANVIFFSNLQKVDSVEWLSSQLKFAQAMSRNDIVLSTLERLFAIEPNNLDGLYYQTNMYLKLNQIDDAKATFEQLKSLAPNAKQTEKLTVIFAIKYEKKAEFQHARLLARSGRNEEALKAYQKLFPNGMPTEVLQLEYLQVEGNIDSHWSHVKSELELLNLNYPGVPIFQLALANHIRKQSPADPWILATYQRLALKPNIGKQAATAWLRALNQLPITDDVGKQYAILASYYPTDLEIKRANQSAQRRLATEKELRKDPTYLAKLKGLALLEKNQTNAAARQLQYAMTTRPNDPEILGGMGKVYLRWGNQTKALVFFKKALENDNDPDNQSKWKSLIDTSSYWAFVDQGDKYTEKKQYSRAERQYKKAKALQPNNPYTLNRLAELYGIKGNYKEADRYYIQALKRDSLNSTALRGRIDLLLSQNKSDQAIRLADTYSSKQKRIVKVKVNELKIDQLNKEVQAALLAGDNPLASQKVEALLLLKPTSAWQRADIADALRMTGQSERADRLMVIWTNNVPEPEMRFAYALYLSRNGQLNAAVAELEKIDIAQRSPAIERNLARLKLDLELGDIQSLFLVQPFEAEQQLKLLSINYKSNPEAMMRIASTWVELLQPTKAITIFDELIFDKQWPFSTQLSYGELIVKLQKYHVFEQWIKQFNGDGLSSSEYSALRQLNTRRYLSEADSKMLTGNYAEANNLYTVVSMQAGPLRTDGQIGVLQSSVLLQTSSQYSKLAEDLYAKRTQLTAKQLVDVAVVFNQIDRKNQANTLNSILLTKHDAEAMDYRDAMSVAMVNHEWGMADTLAYQALNSDRIEKSKTPLQVNEEKPELRELYDNADDYWLTRNVKRDIDKLRDRNDGHVVFGFDYSGRDGENTAFQIPIEARIPIAEYNGHLLIRIDSVSIRSGELEYFNKTSAENVTEAIDQSAFGTALGVGWEAETWSADIGTTPIGFDHATWVGGVNLNGDIRDFGWNATLSRRPETSSMLSYAGLSVPSGSPPAGSIDQEGTEWGGVVRTGVKLGGSYDIGGPTGFWSSLQYHQITGEKVEDNTRIGLLGGGYYKLIAEDDERLSLGMNLMYLTYDKNLSEYTLGHGGYYSPQSYFSISLPVNYYGRFDNTWAYLFNGSISNSWTKEDAPYLFTSDSSTGGSSTGGGFGYSFLAALEKRVSKRWYIGASLDLQRSDFYEPNHFILYARYTFNDRWQLIPTPANTPLLYSDFD